MGCWNHTFWDNDDCLDVLHLFLAHLGLIAPKKQWKLGICMIPGMGPLVTMSDEEMVENLKRLFFSVSKETVESALDKDPDFVTKLHQDMTTEFGNMLKNIGVSFETFWVLLRMHVCMPVEKTDLEVAAQDFAIRVRFVHRLIVHSIDRAYGKLIETKEGD